MRLAVVSDIHGNLPALDAVCADIAACAADAVINLGDGLSGPLWPLQTAQRLMALGWPTLAGNHERQILTQPRERMSPADRHAAEQLDNRALAWLRSQPATLWWSGEVYACHGTPASDVHYWLETVIPGFDRSLPHAAPGVRAATVEEAQARLAGAGVSQAGVSRARVALCGHSHMPRQLQLPGGPLVVNPGSVGLQAYDDAHPHLHLIETGSPHARWALLTPGADGWQAELRRVAYDWEAAAAQAERNGRGDWADALRTGRVGRWEADVVPAE